MHKRFVIALIVLAALVGVGLLVVPLIIGTGEVTEQETASADAGVDTFVLDVTPEPEAAHEVVIMDVNGRVLRQAESGELVEVREGESVPADARLEIEDGSAVLSLTEQARVELESESVVTLTETDDGVAGVRLDRGRTVARSNAGADGVRLTFADSDAVAETRDGEIAAVTDGAGRVTVASERGTVRLSAQGEVVDIQEGEESAVLPNSAPSTPRAVPSSFFLRVRRPPSQTRVAATTIQGQATPGSLVSVDGTPADVDENGRFRARVALRQGQNDVTVRGRDASGRTETRMHRVVVDSSASGISSDVSWD